jgi:hypothetical protein
MEFAVLPECYVDTCFIETIVPPEKGYNHQKGSGTVAKKMKEHFSDRFALGIIDKDKRPLNYLKEFNLLSTKTNIELFKHRGKHHFFILINPAIEVFILTNAAAAGILLPDYQLPDTLAELKRESKSVNSKKDVRFKALFNAMLAKDMEEIRQLIYWITYLKNNPYAQDMNHLLNQ